MIVRNLHRTLGLILLVPLILWGLTGVIFLLKPGYEGAYQKLAPKQYLLEVAPKLDGIAQWQEVRVLRTVLGSHLLVKEQGQWRQLDPLTLKNRSHPSESEIEALVRDAITSDTRRYGEIVSMENGVVLTSSGVEISVDWPTMTMRQKGLDTQIIGALYKVHYLQWFGVPSVNTVFGALGIALLLGLTLLGLKAYLQGRNKANK